MNLDKIKDKTLAIVGGVCFVLGMALIVPWSFAIPTIIILGSLIGAALYLKGLWV